MLMLINQLKNASSVPQLFTIINAINGVNVGIDSSTGALKLEIVDAKILETANLLNIEVNDNGSYSIESSLFNNLGKADTINLSFDYIAKDSTELVSEPKTLTLSIAGSNDALIIQDVVVATVKENTLDNTTLLIDIDSPYALSNFTSDIDITDYFYFERANDKLGLTILNTDPELLLALQSNNLAYIKNIAVELISIPEIAVVLNSITDVNMLMLINQLKNASSVPQLFTIINAINGVNVGIDSSTGALKLEIVDAKILETANLLKIDIDGSGSYTVESALFNNMSIRDSISLSFEYNGTDSGGATTSPKTITVNIAGSNDAPTANISSTIVSKESPSYMGHLVASDVDANDVLTYTYDNTSVSMTLSVTGLNNLDSLVALNNPLAIQTLTELKTVGLTFVNTGNVLALTTLSSSTIVAAKVAVSTLQDFLDSNSGLKNDIVALKDFISANKASIIANTALVAQDIVLLETLLTPSNITALGNLFNTLETFVSDPVAQAIVKNILADNVVSPTELALLAPIAPQIQLLRTEIVTLLAANPAIIGLLDIPTIISKLQEVVDVDTVKGEITATVEVPSSIAEMMINLDENTGEYTVTNPYLVSLPDATQVEVNFNYTVTDSAGDTDTSTAAMLITTAEVNEMNVSINDNNVLIIEEDHDIDMASLLLNATSNLNVADIDSIDLSNSEHILSNITKADFEAMVSDDSSNTLSITGENDDIVKLDLSIWTKNESDTDLNSIVDNNDDHFIAYTTLGTHDQVLTLLIDKDITVENI
jgi:VCBS repeat-containing protein